MYEQEKAEASQLMAARQQRGGIATGAPRDPGPIDRARELTGYLAELEDLQATTRTKLYGSYPSPPDTAQLGKRIEEPCLDEVLLLACQRAALLVGEAKNILNRL